jgi:hypothetical protein
LITPRPQAEDLRVCDGVSCAAPMPVIRSIIVVAPKQTPYLEPAPARMGRVGIWRGGIRPSMSVSAPFV